MPDYDDRPIFFLRAPKEHSRLLAANIVLHMAPSRETRAEPDPPTIYPPSRLEPMIFQLAMALSQLSSHRAARPRLRAPSPIHLDKAWEMIDSVAGHRVRRFHVRLTPTSTCHPEPTEWEPSPRARRLAGWDKSRNGGE